MNFNFAQLFSSYYYTILSPQGDFISGYPLLIFFLALTFISPLLRKFAPDNKYFKKAIKKRTGKFVAFGVLGILSVLSRFALIPMFSMRLWLYIIFVSSLVALVWTGIKVKKGYTDRLQAVDRERRKKGQV